MYANVGNIMRMICRFKSFNISRSAPACWHAEPSKTWFPCPSSRRRRPKADVNEENRGERDGRSPGVVRQRHRWQVIPVASGYTSLTAAAFGAVFSVINKDSAAERSKMRGGNEGSPRRAGASVRWTHDKLPHQDLRSGRVQPTPGASILPIPATDDILTDLIWRLEQLLVEQWKDKLACSYRQCSLSRHVWN